MSYQVVARKWRPQRFEQVVGQDHITETLKYAVLNKRIAPVYLFTGIRGTGKTTLARILVKSVNCLDLQSDGEPCNKCENCIEIMEGRSPDFVEIDGASNNSVDDVRNIKENISYYPVKSKFKVYIIDEVHMLSKSAFNALLKTLEEPPSHTIFILATTDHQKIPATVLSRCQRYDLRRLSLDDVAKQLSKILDSEGHKYDMESLYAIAREGEGSMRDSQTILEQLITFGDGSITEQECSLILGCSDKKQIRGIIEAVIKKDPATSVALVTEIYRNGKSIEKAAKDILYLLHHIVLFSELKNHDYLESPKEEKEWIEKCSAMASTPDWIRLFRFWNEQHESIKTSDFALMIFEVAVITACNFPTMDDFRTFAKALSEGASVINLDKNGNEPEKEKKNLSETVSLKDPEPEKPVSFETKTPDTPDEPVREYNWEAFTEYLKDEDPYFYGALVNIPYSEDDYLIALSVDMNLEMAKKDILHRLKLKFSEYFKGTRELEIRLETGSDLSIHNEKEIERLNEIKSKKDSIINSNAVKEAIQLGLELKKVDVE
ncbi:MAG TPA: DNA polymerase III subunit gamma/tau [bacterium]|jgi:DNA polymerase-3 subunit gamma/tau|nr:DNA polymerase III subunit gamma/tau [bacterium]HNZ53017.1 DNA polymerase III subunit gamma/tau [bacterium]HOG43105.1 DNA polymerase III subunit gamma/tau [bacterium]HPY14068.1 DNA polymerase III subunit gamma/tau [bacterium]HQB09239.1 DNA polymerase III subunit gamma/tau [bacterium]